MFQAFPLQHKKMVRFSLPFIRVGVCEVMNCMDRDTMSSFNVHNKRNSGLYSLAGNNDGSPSVSASPPTTPMTVPFMAEVAAGGLCDSLNGHHCSRYIARYLARLLSLHSVLPGGIAELRRELKDDPMATLMISAFSRERALQRSGFGASKAGHQQVRHIFSEWEMQQYAMFADGAFVDTFRKNKRNYTESLAGGGGGSMREQEDEIANTGCRAVWFTASVVPYTLQRFYGDDDVARHRDAVPPIEPWIGTEPTEGKKSWTTRDAHHETLPPQEETPSFCLDILVSNVGDSRAFGVSRHRLSRGRRNVLDSLRERVVPLSVDHKPLRTQELRRIIGAGGAVRPQVGDIIDGNPLYNVSRSFGHWSMKNNMQRSPSEQKLIALPTCNSWEMLPGDVLILCNHATFETRCREDTSVDEIVRVVVREIDRGASPEDAAGAVCDYSIRFGAEHSLQVLVAIATEDANSASTGAHEAQREEWVVPGPIYAEPCHRLPAYREALQSDCERCKVTLAELLELRWRRVRDILPTRHALQLMPYYGKECTALQQIMDEEALLFSRESLPPSGYNLDDLTDLDWMHIRKTFEVLSRSLMTPQTPSSA